jgi:hypothetical protein
MCVDDPDRLLNQIRELLWLKAVGLSARHIATMIGSARLTVQACVRRA